MKFSIVGIASLFILGWVAPSWGQTLSWADNYGGESNIEWANDVLLEEDRLIVCGVSSSSNGAFANSQGQDMWLLITDTTGNVENAISFGGSANEDGKEIIATSDGGYAAIGISFSTDGDASGANYQGNGDIWVLKLDSEFNIEWQQMFGGSRRDEPQAILETTDGNLLIAGYTASADGDVTGFHQGSPIWNDAWILKLSPSGTIIWQKCIGGTGDEAAWAIVETPTAYVFSGHSVSVDGDIASNYGNRDLMVGSLAKATGEINWVKTYGGSEMDTGLDLLYSSRNTITVTGHANSDDFDVVNEHGSSEFWFLDLDTLGTIQTSTTYGSPGGDVAFSIQELNSNAYLLSGRAGTGGSAGGNLSNYFGSTDAWVILVDSLGNLQSEQNYGGSNQDIFYSSTLSEQGMLFAIGQTASDDFDLSNNMGGSDWFVASISYEQLINVATVEPYDPASDLRIFPNPSSGQFTISVNGRVVASIYLVDANGKVLGNLQIGENSLELATGVYFVQVLFVDDPRPEIQRLVIHR